jgi:predicted chitinase
MNLDRTAILPLFNGSLSPRQATGLDVLLAEWDKNGTDDARHMAYLLATVHHETLRAMAPLREGFAKTDEGARASVTAARRGYAVEDPVTRQVYYGRGLVQITWAGNYREVGDAIEIDLYRNPDLALDPQIAAKIAVIGMTHGLFSGKKLADYFNDEIDDPIEARRIINGTDKAALAASYHRAYLAAITA